LGIDAGLHAVAAADTNPIAGANAGTSERARWAALRAVVLGAAVDVVKGQRVIDGYAVRLQAGQICEIPPGRSAVVGFVQTAVVADEQVVGVRGIERQRVIVSVDRPWDALHRLTPVVGDVNGDVHGVDAVELVRVGVDFAVILRIDNLVVALPDPGCTAVGGAEEAAFFAKGRDVGIDDVRILRRYGKGDAAQINGRYAGGELFPIRAGVFGFENAAFRTAADQDT